jgi:hypothetical protein
VNRDATGLHRCPRMGRCFAERILRQASCRNAKPAVRKFILCNRFQIGLPPIGKAVMLRVNWRLPGGRPGTQPK